MQTHNLNQIPTIHKLDIRDTPEGTVRYYWLDLVSDGFGNPVRIPIMIARGCQDGPTLGLTAAVHGNELNGIPVIQRLFAEIDPKELSGTIVGIPVVNVPSYMRKKRRFTDGVDLNHIMPGKHDGTVSQTYAYRFIDRIAKQFDYLLDLHTASQGRINSFYVRADMNDEKVRRLALLQNADIIVHNPPSDGTLRGAIGALGIPAITIEVGNPNTFQRRLIRSGIEGIHNVLCHLKMIEDNIVPADQDTIICKNSYWLYTDVGGLLSVQVNLLDLPEKGQVLAEIRDIFGKKIKTYIAPEKGIVVGKSTSPVSQTGGRILHLGIINS
ncbi:MAG: succinylglutamate desuccinylase/aspartoacylase family protein [Saprospiraceae bacterium]|nr:succinylglutamate desuccinylase/aspartoacylase family protein [Saprospiraceae bacterium]